MAAFRSHDWQPGRVEIIAGTPRGGGQDRAARALASALAAVVDAPIDITNVPGRGGGNAWDELVAGQADGERLSISSPTLVTNHLTAVAEIDHKDVSQIALLCTEYIVFAVPAASHLVNPLDLIEFLQTPERLTVSLATALGNVNHVALGYLARHAGVSARDIGVRVFDSARDAIADALPDPMGVVAVSAASILPEVAVGSLRPLAISSPDRLGNPLETVPTWSELGIGCTIGTWRGVVAPQGLTRSALEFWADAIRAAVNTDPWRDALSKSLWSDTYLGPAETAAFMLSEERRMRTALEDLGLLG